MTVEINFLTILHKVRAMEEGVHDVPGNPKAKARKALIVEFHAKQKHDKKEARYDSGEPLRMGHPAHPSMNKGKGKDK